MKTIFSIVCLHFLILMGWGSTSEIPPKAPSKFNFKNDFFKQLNDYRVFLVNTEFPYEIKDVFESLPYIDNYLDKNKSLTSGIISFDVSFVSNKALYDTCTIITRNEIVNFYFISANLFEFVKEHEKNSEPKLITKNELDIHDLIVNKTSEETKVRIENFTEKLGDNQYDDSIRCSAKYPGSSIGSFFFQAIQYPQGGKKALKTLIQVDSKENPPHHNQEIGIKGKCMLCDFFKIPRMHNAEIRAEKKTKECIK